MICEHIELRLESLDNRDVAKAMLKFWTYQHDQARQQYTAVACRLESAHRANEQAREEWRRSDELGFGPTLPFSEGEIKGLESRMPALEKNLQEAKHMLGYIINFITDRAHP